MRRSGTHGLLRVRAQVPQTFRAFFDLTFIAILRSCQEVASSCCAKRIQISGNSWPPGAQFEEANW